VWLLFPHFHFCWRNHTSTLCWRESCPMCRGLYPLCWQTLISSGVNRAQQLSVGKRKHWLSTDSVHREFPEDFGQRTKNIVLGFGAELAPCAKKPGTKGQHADLTGWVASLCCSSLWFDLRVAKQEKCSCGSAGGGRRFGAFSPSKANAVGEDGSVPSPLRCADVPVLCCGPSGEALLLNRSGFWPVFATLNFMVRSSLDRTRLNVFQLPDVLESSLSGSPK